mgnify:CR=1 FL=1
MIEELACGVLVRRLFGWFRCEGGKENEFAYAPVQPWRFSLIASSIENPLVYRYRTGNETEYVPLTYQDDSDDLEMVVLGRNIILWRGETVADSLVDRLNFWWPMLHLCTILSISYPFQGAAHMRVAAAHRPQPFFTPRGCFQNLKFQTSIMAQWEASFLWTCKLGTAWHMGINKIFFPLFSSFVSNVEGFWFAWYFVWVWLLLLGLQSW